MDAELVLDRMRAHVVARAGRAVGVQQELRHQEQRDAARAGRRVRQPRQHEVDDVVGEVVLAIGDEDLLPGDAIAAVGGAHGAGAQGADVGARLRLGELHRAHPLAGHELRQIAALERVAAVLGQRVDPRHGQQRPEPEGQGGRVPHLDAGGVERMRQRLAAPLRGSREPVPAGLRPGAVGLLPAGRRGDGAVLERRAVVVADRVERRQNVGGEPARLLEHRRDHVLGEIAVDAVAQRRAEPGAVLERKGDVGDRRPVGHRWSPAGRGRTVVRLISAWFRRGTSANRPHHADQSVGLI